MRGNWQASGVWVLGLMAAAINGCTLDQAGQKQVVPNCGNGHVNAGEQCDGADLGTSDCKSLGFAAGTLGCTSSCTFDTSGCTTVCGDNHRQGSEECDGHDLDGKSCQSLGFNGGTLVCAPTCTLDTSGCSASCGNGVIDPPEQCDGANLDNKTCQDFTQQAGTLACNADCTFDLSGCPGCGNGVIEAGEICDGHNLAGYDCTGGLSCTADCLLDMSACTLASLGDGTDGALEVPDYQTYDLSQNKSPAFAVTSIIGSGVVLAAAESVLAQGNEVMLINLQGSSTECSRAGTYEFLKVDTASGTQVTFSSPVQGIYGNSGGNGDLAGQKIALVRVPHYASVHVPGHAILNTAAWNGATGGVLVMRVAGALSIDAGGALSADGLGYAGGQGLWGPHNSVGWPGESICGPAVAAGTQPNKGGGGGGQTNGAPGDSCGQGGGGGGFGLAGGWLGYANLCQPNNNAALNGGATYGAPDLATLLLGSGGGSGATDNNANESGWGGKGGGLVLIFARQVTLNGTLTANGQAGLVSPILGDTGNGGGGSGGAIYLFAGSIDGAGQVSAMGGLGAPSGWTDWNSPGANGGDGRIRVDYQQAGGSGYGSAAAASFLTNMVEPDPGTSAPYLK